MKIMIKRQIKKNMPAYLMIILIFSLLSLLAGCNEPIDSAVNEPVMADIQPAAAISSITVSGVVESAQSRNVYTTLGFMVDRIYAEVGDSVAEGQVLAVLDTEDLELTIAQQRSALETARQNSQNTLASTQRMLNEATVNLANNTNPHILSAEAALNAAAINLEAAQRNYNDALRDYTERTNPQVLSAESILRTARIEFETREREHTNLGALHAGGIVSEEEMRQAESALTHARNQYNDARISYENAATFQRRSLEQLRTALQSARTSHQNAQEMLNAARIAAQQDIERLRSNVASAELTANLEHMEIALEQLEKRLEDSTITAPITGTVTAVTAREGAVGMGQMFAVENTDNLRIITSFREYDLGRVKEGMEVTITSDATGDVVYNGVISRINPAATPFAPVVEFEAEVVVTSVNTDLRIGMNTRLNIVLE